MSAAALLLCAALAAGSGGAAADPFPRAGASYLVAVDGEVRWARDADAPRPPASLAKLLTALVVLDGRWDPDAWLPVSARAAGAIGSRARLRAGEEIRARDALAAMLVGSANDACLVLAEHAAGTAEAFVDRMNGAARAMALRATRLSDPCGLDAPGQSSTARDLWALAREALRRPEIRSVVGLRRWPVVTRDGRAIAVGTTNALLGRVAGVDGVKTGYTARAGRCLIARAERGGVEVVLVLLGAREAWPDRWWSAAALLEAAFDDVARR